MFPLPWLDLPPTGWQNSKGRCSFCFFPFDDALYSVAFGTHTIQKRLNRSRCRLGWWVGVARGIVQCVTAYYHFQPWQKCRVTIPEGEGSLGVNMGPTSLTPLWIANWTRPCSGLHTIGADAWLQALDESIIGREEEGLGLGLALTPTVTDRPPCCMMNQTRRRCCTFSFSLAHSWSCVFMADIGPRFP